MVEEDIINDMHCAQEYLQTTNTSIVAVKNTKIISEKTGDGLLPFLEIINELGETLSECVVGDKLLGKASALLCRYSRVRGVYSIQGTKTAIALLLMGSIPCQVDSMIPFIKNRAGDDICPFERLLRDVDDPKQAFDLLTEKLMNP